MEQEDFERVHAILLASAGLPSSLYSQLYSKLREEVFDGGEFFEVEGLVDDFGQKVAQRRLIMGSKYESLAKESQVFLVDHAWSFRLADARNQLESISGLAERMGALMCVTDESEASVENSTKKETGRSINSVIEEAKTQAEAELEGEGVCWLNFDDLPIDDSKLQSLNLPTNFPNLVGLSLWGTKLKSLDVVLDVVRRLPSLHALWLNDTPLVKDLSEEVMEAVLEAVPLLEIYNSKLTKNYSQWAIGFYAEIFRPEVLVDWTHSYNSLKEVSELDLSDRNIQKFSGMVFNSAELPLLAILNIKGNPLKDETRSSLIQVLSSLPSLRSIQVDIPGPLGASAVQIVESLPKLERLNGVEVSLVVDLEMEVIATGLKPRYPKWSPEEPLVERVLRAMWLYIMTYRLADEEKLDETPIWYVMDELGSALRHSDVPNFRVAPFMYMPDGTLDSAISYSLLWPVQDVHQGQECTRDYLSGLGEDKQRSARLTAWFHTPKHYFLKEHRSNQQSLRKLALNKPAVTTGSPTKTSQREDCRSLAVYTDIPFVTDFLQRPEFSLVEDPKDADIIWTCSQIDEDVIKAVGIRSDQYINQFPFEACLVMKHHLARTMQKAYGCPAWLQPTHDMETQLAVLIGDYLEREDLSQNNLWIVKPWNMARTIDTTVTSNLPELIRLVETGPKIGQKYIDPPALFKGYKFDLRYIVLLRCVNPLEIYLYDIFWARLSLNPYSTEEKSLSDYETQFTVMNYRSTVNNINIHEFVPEFEKEHNVNWKEIHERVKSTIRQVFEGAALVHPEMHSPYARAMYGVDVMLDDAFQPKLLEVTYCPDCTRACKYDVKKVMGDGELALGKDFVNVVFGTLFLNEEKNVHRL